MAALSYILVAACFVALVKATSKITCEHETMNLDCGKGNVIKIKDANYGRKNTVTCHHHSIKTTSCGSTTSLNVVHQQCHNQRSCTVKASNEVFGDPCIGTFKYLEVDYDCDSIDIDGGWSNWSKWSEWTLCGKDCMTHKTRTRTCTNPSPSGNGKNCQGSSSSTESESCYKGACLTPLKKI